MQVTALGHSCVLLELQRGDSDGSTRILVDPWLSDHAVGDGMGRFPRVRFQVDALGPIDGVYLTHAHSDHLDPYTLIRLWDELASPPVLLLPVSLSYLCPLFREHLGDPEIVLLEPHTVLPFRGLELLGFFDIGFEATNEDDVMVLALTNGPELALVEADAELSLEHPEFRAFVSELLRGPGIESAVFLTTENELTGTLEGRLCQSVEQRMALAEYASNEMLEAVHRLYAPVDDPGDLWQGPHVLRLIHGQGLTAPHELDPDWQHILFPVRIAHRVQAERAAAERSGCQHRIDSLRVGCVHTIVAGELQDVAPLAGLELLDPEENRTYDPQRPFFPALPCAPLRDEARDTADQRRRILGLLDGGFRAHLFGARTPPVLHLLPDHGGAYRVRVHYGQTADEHAWDYVLGFDTRGFVEVEPGDEEPDEAYWANDLDDFLEGRCDEFSTFCRAQFPVSQMRLWSFLATPLLQSDLVFRRVKLHFERARDGLSPGSYVVGLYR